METALEYTTGMMAGILYHSHSVFQARQNKNCQKIFWLIGLAILANYGENICILQKMM